MHFVIVNLTVLQLFFLWSFFFLLQVQTKLENPTRYHVIQKQKSQVRQYLSESFQQPLNRTSYLQQFQESQCQPQTQSAPGITNNYSSVGTPTSVTPAPALYAHSHPLYAAGPSPSPNSDAPVMSPALSSGATSTSEVSYILFIINILLSLDLITVNSTRNMLVKLQNMVLYDFFFLWIWL